MVTDGNMSLASITSNPTNIAYMDNIVVQLNFTGTPVGTFEIQVSIDYEQDDQGNVLNTGNWTALALSPNPAAAGSAATIFLDLNQMGSMWVRVKYTRTSGTGTLNAFIAAKML